MSELSKEAKTQIDPDVNTSVEVAQAAQKERAAGATPPKATAPNDVPPDVPLDNPSLYFNRELSEIDFHWRVFYQAKDERLPLLERVRFLSITASNMDEFFQKRVGGLKRQEVAGVRKLSPDGRTPAEQLELIRPAARVMYEEMAALWEALKAELIEQAGFEVTSYSALSDEDKEKAGADFQSSVYPILTPLAVDPGRPFPFISNLSLSLAVRLRHPERDTHSFNNTHFARIKVPLSRGRWYEVGADRVIPLEHLIAHHVQDLFAGMDVLEVHAFRVTRNADLRRDEEEADDLLAMISEELRERRFAPVVRLEVETTMPEPLRTYLLEKLELDESDLYPAPLLSLADLSEFADLPREGLQYPSWKPVTPPRLAEDGERETDDIFATLRRGDVLVHHPYERFRTSVLRLVEEAAQDERVVAVKQTLYRTSDDSPTVAALVRAAERGKQVAVLVEVKARFDEANNIEWGQMLENSGVHVAYGLVGLKTHAKATLVIREEDEGVRTYVHIGTGNYHIKTARLYTDLGLLSADPTLGADVTRLFHYLTGYAPEQRYDALLVAPRDMRKRFLRLIEGEIEQHKADGSGRIIAKMNGLDDTEIIRALYRASQAGVQIDLIVRGLCRLRPGLPGISETIRVMSILGRFLEHDRVYYFHNGGAPHLYLGSADWRRRNLSDRVEAVAPVEDAALQRRLIETLEAALEDNRLAWDLRADGQYAQRNPAAGEEVRNYHDTLIMRALDDAQVKE